MNEIDLRRFDLNLLVVFDVLMSDEASPAPRTGLGEPNRLSAILCPGCARNSAIPC